MNDPESSASEGKRQGAEHAIERLYDAQEAVKDAQSALREDDVLPAPDERRYDAIESAIDDLIKDIEEAELPE